MITAPQYVRLYVKRTNVMPQNSLYLFMTMLGKEMVLCTCQSCVCLPRTGDRIRLETK